MRVVNRSGKSGREAAKLLTAYLDDRFTLAYHVRMRGLKEAVDAALVGPHGVTVLAFADDKIRVRCLGDNWYTWNPKFETFDPALHNPVKKVLGDRAAMEAHVNARQMGTTMPLDCAVMVPESNLQVEYMQPAVPVMSAEKISVFAAQLVNQRELIEWTQADDLLKSLGVPPLGIPWRQLDQPAARAKSARSRRFGGLTRQQIIILAVIAVADLAVLIGGLVVVLLPR
jgi:DNA-directed RNA polymerase subunit H (RpoH/RPB5)